MGAIGGPCSGHLSLSQVALMEASAVGQLNSLPSISQTWAVSPGWNVSDCDVEQRKLLRMIIKLNGCIKIH